MPTVDALPSWLRYPVAAALDVFEPRRAVRELAHRAGFPRRGCEELVIVVSELATNILKHGARGEIGLAAETHPEAGPFVAIAASDEGPPIPDLGTAVRDGYDARGPIDPMTLYRRGGIGGGLGAVVRLTDALEQIVGPSGKILRAVRYRDARAANAPPRVSPFDLRPPPH